MSTLAQRSDLKWGYFAQALNIGSGLLLLPFVVIYLPNEQVGLWFVFITLTALAQLLEFGFQPTVARNTAYVYAGTRELLKIGLPTNLQNKRHPHIPLLAELIAASRLIYRSVALLAGVVLFVGGTFYINTLLQDFKDSPIILGAWLIYASGTVINFYFGYANALLQGRGDVSLSNKVLIGSRSVFLILGLGGLIMGSGLLGIGVAMLASCAISRWLAMRYLQIDPIMYKALTISNGIKGGSTIRILWHNASRLGLVQVSTFLIQRANILISSSVLGLTTAASYGMTVTILMTLSSVSMAVLQIRLPLLTRARAMEEQGVAQSLFGEILIFSWLIYLVGFLILLIAGNPLLELISGKETLLPTLPLFILGIIFALEMNHSIAGTYLTTRNSIPFILSSVVSGCSIILLSLVWVETWQVWGLIASQGLVQLAYNNWRWPRLAIKDLELSWFKLCHVGFAKIYSNISK